MSVLPRWFLPEEFCVWPPQRNVISRPSLGTVVLSLGWHLVGAIEAWETVGHEESSDWLRCSRGGFLLL